MGPNGFSQIQAAVQAAQDGDTILVRVPPNGGPTYDAVDVAGKALTIAAEPSTRQAKVSSVSVHDLPAGKTVVLSGVNALGGSPAAPSIWLRSNAGSVRLVSCNSRGAPAPFFSVLLATPAMTISSSSGSAAFASCGLVGGLGDRPTTDPRNPGARGLEMQDSIAAAFDSSIMGGQGDSCSFAIGVASLGGDGVFVGHSALPGRLLLSNSSVQGGPGGEAGCFPPLYCVSGNGGTGLRLGSGAAVTLQTTTPVGGPPGPQEAPGCGSTGAVGPAVANQGSLQVRPTPAIALRSPTVAGEGQTIPLTFTGTPGDQVFLLAGAQTMFRELAAGVLLVQPGPTAFPQRGPLGILGTSGTLTLAYPLPRLPAGIGAANLWLQAFATHADGKRTMGSFSVVTMLDSGF
ncbi:MAG: hypothetical protein HOP15_11110 [Planctomycetes bacterium]|nr:hypothetical protein [Planctomycetota bacterium]